MGSRRSVLKALVAGLVVPPVLVACEASPGAASHPALMAPAGSVLLTGLDLASTGAVGRSATLELLGRAEESDKVMVGFGASLFERAGAPSARPEALTAMPPFTGDVLDGARTGGDLLLHVEDDDASRARSRTAKLLRDNPGLRIRWQLAGHRPRNEIRHGRPLMRNPFGYTEGHGNAPNSDAGERILVPSAPGQPAWMAGASLLAVRVVRLAQDAWNIDDSAHQDRIIGRRRDGRWLDGRPATAAPAFDDDPDGAVTPVDAHVRMVNPRTPGTPPPMLLRRSWAYSAGNTPEGQPDNGILFMAYQADFRTGFERAQRRLQSTSAVDALTPYLLAVGGGYFAVPGRRPPQGWASSLFGRPET